MSSADEQYKKKLIERYVAGEASEKELQAFFGLLTEAEIDSLIEEHMDHEILRIREEQHLLTPVKRIRPWKYAAVVSGFLLISIGGYYILNNSKQSQQIAQNKPVDIKPGSKKAILTLSTGNQISLTDALAGTLAKQGNTTVAKTANGEVVYSEEKSTKTEPALVYNTITTPRAGYYPLKMSDGTIAILDAESSIKYPVAFTGNERLVEITGQVYFEVAHNSSKPFRVKVKGQVIEDLGTHFNINAYDDETVIRTTLVEGSIRVSKNGSSVVIKPGQQAVTKPINDEIAVRDVNPDDVIAWKNGQTSFKNEDIHEIMRKVSRWYDVDIQYDGPIPTRHFDGSISRNANLSDLLKILEFNNIHFTVSGKTITVKP